MLKLLSILFISYFICNVAYAQNVTVDRNDTVAYYINKDDDFTANKDSAAFVRIVITPHQSVNNRLFNINDYYLDGKVKLQAVSALALKGFELGLEGPCIEYFHNGRKKSIKQFNKGKLIGDAVSYYPDGKIYTIENNDKGSDIIYLKECRDTSGKILTENGNGKWIKFDNDFKFIYEEGNVVDGKEEGAWIGSSPNGSEIVAVYKDGQLISGKHFNNHVFTAGIDVMPEFNGGIEGYYKFIAQRCHYPAASREHGIQGIVYLTFIVEKDGSLSNIKILEGPGTELNEEAVRVVKLSPRWKSGRQNGEAVRVKYNMPISFSISK